MTPSQSKVRIVPPRGKTGCSGAHEWVQPWAEAFVRQCRHCGAWLVPLDGSRLQTVRYNPQVTSPAAPAVMMSRYEAMIDGLRRVLGAEVLSTMQHHRCDHWVDDKVRRVQMLNPVIMRTRSFSLPGAFCDAPDVQRYPIGWRCAEHAEERSAA
jgi:hypothetical protein